MGWIILIIVISAAITWFAVEPKKQLTVRPEIQMLIDLMAMGKDWQKGSCTWYHPSGVNVWVGNPTIGFSVKWGSKGKMDYDSHCVDGPNRVNRIERNAIRRIVEGKHKLPSNDVAAVAARIAEMYGS